jgi:hypothetical protein
MARTGDNGARGGSQGIISGMKVELGIMYLVLMVEVASDRTLRLQLSYPML